jgi:tetratricopeptide (TPR) repeat protein
VTTVTAGDGWTAHNQVSGMVAGHSVQAASVYGGIHFHAPEPRERSPVPRQLLAPPPDFTGRESELARLDELVAVSQRDGVPALIVLSGPGGVGKTALALRWAYNAGERFADGQLYIDLAGFSGGDPLDPGEALGQFLRALGVPAAHVPSRLAEQAALFRSLTAQLALLVLLDNAYSTAQVRALLPSSARSVVIVTSRSRLAGLVGHGGWLVDVGPLDEPAAVALLARAVRDGRVAGEPERATTLVRMCGGLPIAVRLAAARLAARPRWSVGRVVAELADERARLTALAAHHERSLQATFDLSYQLLTDRAARLYRRLSLHPGLEFGSGVAAPALGCQPSETSVLVDELVDANLLEETGEDRYRFHDLLRLHARHCAATHDSAAELDAALRSVLEWYLAAAMNADRAVTPYRRRLPYEFASPPSGLPGFAERDRALAWLEAERTNLLAAGQAALERGWFALSWQLVDVMWPLLLYRKHYRDRLDLARRGIEAGRGWGNTFAEAAMHKQLGLACTTLGRHDEAERHLRRSLAQSSALDDSRGVADAAEGLGLLYLETGRVETAVEQFERVLALNRGAGADRQAGLVMINLARAVARLGQTRRALRHLEEARTIFDRLADVDPYNGARVLVALAELHCTAGDLDAATATAQAGLDAMRRLGSEHGEAEAHEVLAEAELRRGDVAAAREHFDRATTTVSSLRSPRAGALRSRLGACIYRDAAPGAAAAEK